ncbi:acetyl/propionyl/methylcrotonyl-CoA carboxylase subunit alpha [Nesterenkonia muleiensis]|uniref:acetyl/propionyl/methylcrotonyl-CoA carboxylase subunit alpha n=1 Tax=Nesterenkonia muleiensis TaxID=2282648 RepID=UPI000E70FEAF|nr:biotin carboxylase N-terminal domain-containing protein [Nesterenkonia muleiensis]
MALSDLKAGATAEGREAAEHAPSAGTSTDALFTTVLVANRGEIACRVIRTLHSLAISSVAVYSEADAAAKHVALADRAVCLGPAAATASYLNIEAVIGAAKATGAEAIHPGYGFLSENVAFAQACAEAGITFIGPGAHALEVMGDKIRSKNHVARAGVPLVQGISEPGLSDDQLVSAAAEMTFPVLIKPSAGGGGKGMHVVQRHQDLAETLTTARRVAQAAFGDDTLFIEQLISSPRHIEVQVLADAHGGVIHLGERECSLQRRHQKVIEEAPSTLLDEQTRQRIGEAACSVARSVGYRGAGTVEFLVSDKDPSTFYFMEMNTRLQVEHPVTEEVTGIDLVEQQIRIAAGQPLGLEQGEVRLTGHSVEARVYAEDAQAGFMPSTGEILTLEEPQGVGVRVDSGLLEGQRIGTEYDPMLAKIIATGGCREQALARLDRALGQMVVLGVTTNTGYLQQLVQDPDVRSGRMDTTMIERKLPAMSFPVPQQHHAEAAARFAMPSADLADTPSAWRLDGWRSGAAEPAQYQVLAQHDDAAAPFQVTFQGRITLEPTAGSGRYLLRSGGRTLPVRLRCGERRPEGTTVWIHAEDFTGALTVLDHQAQTLRQLAEIDAELTEAVPEVRAPMPGTVVALGVVTGDQVSAGDVLVTIEAMKMEHQLTAPLEGRARIHVSQGDTVRLGQVVAAVEADPEAALADPESKET